MLMLHKHVSWVKLALSE